MPEIVAGISWMLKEVYEKRIWEVGTRKTVLLDTFERTDSFVVDTPAGRVFYVPVLTNLPQGINTVRSMTAAVPTPTPLAGVAAQYAPCQVTGEIQYDFRQAEAGGNKEAGWERYTVFYMEKMIESIRRDLNRQLFSDGTGILASCSAMAAAGNNIPVNTTAWIEAHAQAGAYVDIINNTNGAVLAQNRQVTAKTATQITISGTAVQTTANHVVVRSGAWNGEIAGLGVTVAADKALGGLDPAVAGNEKWKATVEDANGAGPSVPLFNKLFQAVEDAGGVVKLIVVGNDVYNGCAAHLTSYKRVPVESSTLTLPGGHKGIDWNGVALTRDRDCPSGTAFFLDTEVMKMSQLRDGHWQDLGGDIVQWDGGRGYKALWIWDVDLVTMARDRLAKIINLAGA
jgi:hypothetical protein